MPAKVRKLRPTKGGKIGKGDMPTVKISTHRTEQACSRALVYLERAERRAFIKAMRELKPQIQDWARYLRHTQGKDSADLRVVMTFWRNMVSRYKAYQVTEMLFDGLPKFDPDVNPI
jgi:hypothetical protein